jgi:ribokinase
MTKLSGVTCGVPRFPFDVERPAAGQGGKAMQAARLCVVGSANVDLTFRTPRLPRPGETLAGHSFRLDGGGKGANQAVAAARLGARVALVACLGDDAFGREALARYRAEGLDTSWVRLDGSRPTGTAAIVVDDAAQNSIVVVAGANAGLSAVDVDRAAAAVRGAAVVLCQLETPLEATLAAFRLARAAGVRTVLTPAPAAALPDELYRLCDLCVPNETEAELLTGRAVGGPGDAETAAGELRRRGVRAVVVTLGERGALLLDDDGATPVAAVPARAVDPTGAGDAFTAALAVFWAEGLALREAAGRAAAVAALTVTRPGAQSAFPTRAEVAF